MQSAKPATNNNTTATNNTTARDQVVAAYDFNGETNFDLSFKVRLCRYDILSNLFLIAFFINCIFGNWFAICANNYIIIIIDELIMISRREI